MNQQITIVTTEDRKHGIIVALKVKGYVVKATRLDLDAWLVQASKKKES